MRQGTAGWEGTHAMSASVVLPASAVFNRYYLKDWVEPARSSLSGAVGATLLPKGSNTLHQLSTAACTHQVQSPNPGVSHLRFPASANLTQSVLCSSVASCS